MGARKLKRRIARLEARIARLEHHDLPEQLDVSGDPIDTRHIWRHHTADYQAGYDDGDDWRYL